MPRTSTSWERIHSPDDLTAAIEATATRGPVIDPKVVEVLVAARSRVGVSSLAGLTPREREILAQIAQGASNSAIAASLGLTKRAVEKHINSLFGKLDLPESEDLSRRVKAALLFLAGEAGQEPAAGDRAER